MSVKIKLFSKTKQAVNNAVKNYDKLWKEQRTVLNESLENDSFKCLSGTVSEIATNKDWRKGTYAMKRHPKIILLETSVHSQPSLDSAETLTKVVETTGIDPEQIEVVIHYDNQKIYDIIGFCFKVPTQSEYIDNISREIDKIMTACGYFMSIEPSTRITERGPEYILQYEPNDPDFDKVFLPEILHHLTTVEISEIIKKKGFIPQTNDIFKHQPRLYFLSRIDMDAVRHLYRRHRETLTQKYGNKNFEFVDIEIKTPEDVIFYYDPHMLNESFFTTETIDSKYIDSIKKYKASLTQFGPGFYREI